MSPRAPRPEPAGSRRWGWSTPLNNIGIQQVGAGRWARTTSPTGTSRASPSRTTPAGQVSLSVRLTDVISGQLAHGAIATGLSNPPPRPAARRRHPDQPGHAQRGVQRRADDQQLHPPRGHDHRHARPERGDPEPGRARRHHHRARDDRHPRQRPRRPHPRRHGRPPSPPRASSIRAKASGPRTAPARSSACPAYASPRKARPDPDRYRYVYPGNTERKSFLGVALGIVLAIGIGALLFRRKSSTNAARAEGLPPARSPRFPASPPGSRRGRVEVLGHRRGCPRAEHPPVPGVPRQPDHRGHATAAGLHHQPTLGGTFNYQQINPKTARWSSRPTSRPRRCRSTSRTATA